MRDKIKVVWLCHFSNAFVHERLDLQHNHFIGLVKRLANKPVFTDVPEFANWITNAILELEKTGLVELHIVSPYPYLKSCIQEFTANGIHYHFFRSENDDFMKFLYRHLFHPTYYSYKKNRKVISRIIHGIKPEIVHLWGAENPEYALGLLDTPEDIITIAQLQTLMNDPDFKKNCSIDTISYNYRAEVEKEIIRRANYLGTVAIKYREIILQDIKPEAIILNTNLALADQVVKEECEKYYDFVYFAANLSKAADLALEAFGLAYQRNPNITLDIVGGYNPDYKQTLKAIIKKHNIEKAVCFEGNLPTHEDVINQIRKSRFALLPLRVDLTSGTIREAMSNGLPVITTDTGKLGTQRLNLKNQTVLLSQTGDHLALANNMLRLLEDNALAEMLRENAFQKRQEIDSNEVIVRKYVEAYKACLENFWNNQPIPTELTAINKGVDYQP